MEQHPVPQNVTTFQFRLIGDMTIKQFGYLAGGIILAYIFYKLPLPFFITWPLALFTGLMGIGFAFVPIEERPMDVWVLSFIKSAYSPTQYVWQKKATASSLPKSLAKPDAQQQKSPSVSTGLVSSSLNQSAKTISPVKQLFTVHPPVQSQHQVASKSQSGDIKKPGLFDAIISLFITTKKIPVDAPDPSRSYQNSTPNQFVPPVARAHTFTTIPLPSTTNNTGDSVQTPTSEDTQQPSDSMKASSRVSDKEDAHMKKTQQLEEQVRTLEQELHTKALSDSRILELQKQLTDLLTSKQSLEKELILLRQQAAAKPTQPQQAYRMAGVSQNFAPQSTVNVISANNTARAGIPRLTSIPNVVSGLAKDGDGNLLPGVLVTVRDQNDVPLRALKTNKLGQFAASTPLPNGTYVLEVEDPRLRFLFDRAQITLTGALVPPLEIIAKSQKELTRQKLTQELFGNQTI